MIWKKRPLETEINTLNSNLGAIIANQTGAVSVPSGVRTKISELTLPAGTYVIVRGLDWAQNAKGRRTINRGDSAARNNYVTQNAVAGDDTVQQLVTTEAFTSQTTIELWGVQTSGGNLTAYPHWYVVRLKS